MTPYHEAFEALMLDEGGLGNDPVDRGGETKFGVTKPTLDIAIARGLVPAGTTVATLTGPMAMVLYESLYWRVAHCDELPAPLALQVFDWAVISGPGRAVRGLQEALRVTADGAWGPKTAQAAQGAGDAALVEFTTIRLDFHAADIARNPEQARFAKGWYRRALRTLVRAARAA